MEEENTASEAVNIHSFVTAESISLETGSVLVLIIQITQVKSQEEAQWLKIPRSLSM
jgi:hypothetical protein